MNATQPTSIVELRSCTVATLLLVLSLIAGNCLGGTFTVTRTNISGPGSLPVIINTANATPGSHTIEFSTSGTITLIQPLPLVTNNLTFNGQNNITISGNDEVPIFTFASGTTSSIFGITLERGNYQTASGYGGAISNAGSLLVSGCVLKNNHAPNSGGAIYSLGPLLMVGSTMLTNYASEGAGIFASNTLTVSNCTFIQNQAVTGGAINSRLLLNVADSSFNANGANSNGGAIYVMGDGGITNSVFINNYAGNGGALYTSISVSKPKSLSQLTFSNNSATLGFGGAICAEYGVTMETSLIVSNRAIGQSGANGSGGGGGGAGLGGGLFLNAGGAITNCTFSGNNARGGNGGDTISGTSQEGGRGGGNNPGAGGLSTGSATTLKGKDGGFGSGSGGGGRNGSTLGQYGFSGQFGGNGGDSGSKGRAGQGCGGAIFVNGGTDSVVVNCTVVSNSISEGTGALGGEGGFAGGIYGYDGGGGARITLINSIVAANAATPGSGGQADLVGTNYQSSGFNLFGSVGLVGGLSINDYQFEVPNVGALRNNGGPTLTHALLPNSLAIGGGTSVGAPTRDQRGHLRPANVVDIGAFQFSTGSVVNISTQPLGQSFGLGSGATLSVSATGTGLSYQWQFNGTNISGATDPTLSLANLAATNAGAYRVVVSSSAGGSTTSQSANLLFFGDLKFYGGATLGGPVGQQFRVDYADVVNIGTTNWLVLTNVTLPVSPFLVIDPDSPGRTKRFYRALPLP